MERAGRSLSFAVALVLGFAASGVALAEEPPASRISELAQLEPELVEVSDSVSLALGLGNVFLVGTGAGHVIIDTGVAQQAAAQRDLLLAKHPGAVSHVIVTHGHGDHDGGVALYRSGGATFVAQRRYRENTSIEKRLAPFMARRNAVFWGGFVPPPEPFDPSGLPTPDVIVDDALRLEVGGRRFELLHTPSESSDMLTVWLPDERIAFTGDLYGPSFPNLYTLRGHYYRTPWDYLHSLDRVIALEPEILAPSHFRPIAGHGKIRAALTGLREAVRHVHDETVRGMNEGKDLWTLMREVELPEGLGVDQSHGSIEWSVRAIWEYYVGWFRHESTAELYPVPSSAVHADLAALAGGCDPLVARARTHVAHGRPVEALHLLDVCQSTRPGHRAALDLRLAVLRDLLADAGENFSRQGWLRHRIAETEAALANP